MIEFSDIKKDFQNLEQNDEWEQNFKYNYSVGDQHAFDHAKHSSNEKYNRYRNILPFDHSRVKLKECENTDYINANLVENKYNDKKYILTQGPLRNTCEHFWQMVWEQNTKGIVMLNRLFEKGMPKCEMYFPNLDEENSEMTLIFGKFKLNYISEQPGIDYSIRVIECENLEQKEIREIYHFHFTNWPDFGEPEQTGSFLKFLNECQKRNIFDADLYGPPVVHCSAGVGRSGTFILVDLMIELYKINENKFPCSISNLLDELRSYRMGLVQTHQQFKFAFKAIIDGINKIQNVENTSEVLNHEDIQLDNLNGNNNVDNEEEDETDDDESDTDDDFYENKSKQRRPDTASNNVKTKKFKASKEIKNRIKNLRSLQEKNRLNNENELGNDTSENNNNGYKTVKPIDLRLNLDFLKDDQQNLTNHGKNVASNSNSSDDENDDNPFASSRNIQTVKVNEPRKPLEQTLQVPYEKTEFSQNNNDSNQEDFGGKSFKNEQSSSENGHVYQRKIQSNENLTKSSQEKTVSEKEQRIAEKVKEMKKKQISHEQHQKLVKQIKPFLIGGGILLGGYLIFELCIKKTFLH